MESEQFVKERVKRYYWDDDINCATTALKILSEKFNIALTDQIVNAAIGLHGAGEYGAQCGLVEGTLMFLGIIGRSMGAPDQEIVKHCNDFASAFENRFSSLLCRVLRPQGFNDANPPHLCEGLTCEAIDFNIAFVEKFLQPYCQRI